MTWRPGDAGRAPDWAVTSFLTYVETGQLAVTAWDTPPEAFDQWVLRALEGATNELPEFHRMLLNLPEAALLCDAVGAIRRGARPPTWVDTGG
jgi:hypothetical protein